MQTLMQKGLAQAVKYASRSVIVLFFISFNLMAAPAHVSSKMVVTEFKIPEQIESVMKRTHELAGQSKVRSAPMFNYVYYAREACRADGSEETIQAEMARWRVLVGADFAERQRDQSQYESVIVQLQNELGKRDLPSLHSGRSAQQIEEMGIFVTCLDFAKVVLGGAIKGGFSAEKLKLLVTVSDHGYSQMQLAIRRGETSLPRPFLHFVIAYQTKRLWYLLNVEDPHARPLKLGPELPERLAERFSFQYPAVVAGQPFRLVGAYDPKDFIHGFPQEWLMSILTDGTLTDTQCARTWR